jgi:hypothetical protein
MADGQSIEGRKGEWTISLIRKNNIKVNKKCTIRIKSGGIVCAGAMSCGPSGQTIDRRH